jgi:transposase
MERSQMPWKEASKIELTEKQETTLRKLADGTHTPLHLKQRSQIILMAHEGYSNNRIEQILKTSAKTVTKWRSRYNKRSAEINKIETESPRQVREIITKALSDEQRPGTPPTFTDTQVAAIMLLACEDPKKYDLPVSHWTPKLLQQTVLERGIVESISTTQISRFLKRTGFTATSQPDMAQPKH